jgi:hypothetical protein
MAAVPDSAAFPARGVPRRQGAPPCPGWPRSCMREGHSVPSTRARPAPSCALEAESES